MKTINMIRLIMKKKIAQEGWMKTINIIRLIMKKIAQEVWVLIK